LDNLFSNIIEFFQTLDIVYIYIFLGALFGVSFLSMLIKIILKKKNKKKEHTNTNQVLDYIRQCNDEAIETHLDENVSVSEKKKKKSKKINIVEAALTNAINEYNNLYDIYFNAGYSVNLDHNQTLAYYNSLIASSQEDEVELNSIADEIKVQAQNLYTEISKKYYDEQKKIYYNKCSNKMIELELLFKLTKVDGNNITKNFNERLLLANQFSSLEEYKTLSVEIQRNIDYLKGRYSDTLEKNYYVEDDKNENKEKITIDPELIKSLETLNCNPKERDKEKIRKEYIKLVKKYHSDLSSDKKNNDKILEISIAYDYVKKHL